jgi:hypothetical protein
MRPPIEREIDQNVGVDQQNHRYFLARSR